LKSEKLLLDVLDLATGQIERSEEMLRSSKTPNAACQKRKISREIL